jgi:hypothetical protein
MRDSRPRRLDTDDYADARSSLPFIHHPATSAPISRLVKEVITAEGPKLAHRALPWPASPPRALMHSSANPYLKAPLLAAGSLTLAPSLSNSLRNIKAFSRSHRGPSRQEGTSGLASRPPPTGTTVCFQTHSEWTLSPLDGFKVINGPLNMPHLDFARFANSIRQISMI